jgi:hypothetical protein
VVCILCTVNCGSDGRTTEHRSENVNSSRQLDGECDRRRERVEGEEERILGKWRSLEKNSFLVWKFPVESIVRHIINRLICY